MPDSQQIKKPVKQAGTTILFIMATFITSSSVAAERPIGVTSVTEDGNEHIAVMNADGVPYIAINSLAIWRDDVGTYNKLIVQMEKDATEYYRTCQTLSNNVGIAEGVTKVYKQLNDATANYMESLGSDLERARPFSELVLMREFIRPYAGQKEHGRNYANVSCTKFFRGLLANLSLDKESTLNFCKTIEATRACMSDLHESHKFVAGQSAGQTNLLLNGKPAASDDNTNPFLKALGTTSERTEAREYIKKTVAALEAGEGSWQDMRDLVIAAASVDENELAAKYIRKAVDSNTSLLADVEFMLTSATVYKVLGRVNEAQFVLAALVFARPDAKNEHEFEQLAKTLFK